MKKEDLAMPEESKVGKKLSDLTTKRLIIVVLAMLFSVPLFDTDTYNETPDANAYGLELIASFEYNSLGFNQSFDYYVDESSKSSTPLVLLSAGNRTWESESTNANDLRTNE